MSRRGWKTINISEMQASRIEAAVHAGYARHRDEFVRIWTEIGLVVTGILATQPDLLQALFEPRHGPVQSPGRPPEAREPHERDP